MTDNLTETIRKQFTTMRHLYAGAIATKLRAGGVAIEVDYDNRHTLVAQKADLFGMRSIRIHVAAQGVQMTFPNPYDGAPLTITVAAPYMIDAVVTTVEGLLIATGPCCEPSTWDTLYCCHRRMREQAPEVWYIPGSPVYVERVYTCPICDQVTQIQVADQDEADRLAGEVTGQ